MTLRPKHSSVFLKEILRGLLSEPGRRKRKSAGCACRAKISFKKTELCFVLSSALLLIALNAFAGESAQDIMNNVDRNKKAKYTTATLLLKKDGLPPRKVVMRKLRESPADYMLLLRVEEPGELKNTKYLMVSKSAGASYEEKKWIFLPATNKVRRIATSSEAILDSDFNFEDLREININDYEFSLISNEIISAKKLRNIDLYDRAIFHIDRKINFPTRIQLFKTGKEIKDIRFSEIKEKGGILTPFEITAESKEDGTVSRITMQNVDYNTELKESLFSKDKLK